MACRLNQCWEIVNWTLRNKILWNLNQNSYIFIQENAFENLVWKMGGHFVSISMCQAIDLKWSCRMSQIAKFMGPTWGPPGSCRPQMDPCWPHEACYLGQYLLCVVYSAYNVLCYAVLWLGDDWSYLHSSGLFPWNLDSNRIVNYRSRWNNQRTGLNKSHEMLPQWNSYKATIELCDFPAYIRRVMFYDKNE